MMSNLRDQVDLLTQILQGDESKFEEEKEDQIEEDEDQLEMENIKRRERNIGALTGADTGVYDEYSR
jgi:hypothetical protein